MNPLGDVIHWSEIKYHQYAEDNLLYISAPGCTTDAIKALPSIWRLWPKLSKSKGACGIKGSQDSEAPSNFKSGWCSTRPDRTGIQFWDIS